MEVPLPDVARNSDRLYISVGGGGHSYSGQEHSPFVVHLCAFHGQPQTSGPVPVTNSNKTVIGELCVGKQCVCHCV